MKNLGDFIGNTRERTPEPPCSQLPAQTLLERFRGDAERYLEIPHFLGNSAHFFHTRKPLLDHVIIYCTLDPANTTSAFALGGSLSKCFE
jgi:hypothetical protein